MFSDITEEEMPEDVKKEFLSVLKDTISNIYPDDGELNNFAEGFLNKHGEDLYNYHLKTYTEKEIWESILVSKSEKFQKMMIFYVGYQEYIGKLVTSYMNELDEKEENEWST